MSRRRMFLTAATAAMVVAGPIGCGIPEQTGVQVADASAAPGSGRDDGLDKKPPERKDSGEVVQPFALNFLQAAAGEASGAFERVKKYIRRDQQSKVLEKPGQEVVINVVRLTEESPSITTDPVDGTSMVTISVQQVGLLRANGALEAPVEKDSKYTFKVGKAEGADARDSEKNKGLYVIDPPPVLLMSTEALEEFYRQRTIYFWSKEGPPALVPDLRYLPVAVPREGHATEMVRWLVGGPAGWLQATAGGLPAGTKMLGNVFPQNDGPLVVNLSVDVPLKDEELDRLRTQLVWSLREAALGSKLDLTIKDQGNRVFDVSDQRRDSPAYRIERSPQRFCVYAGAVRRLLSTGEVPSGPAPIAADGNQGIVSAALTRDSGPMWAALVTGSGRSKRLLVGSGAGIVDKFDPSKTYQDMGRPVWLKASGSPNPVGLVVADNRLYRFGSNAKLSAVELPGAAGSVTAVGAALDGRRIAFVAGGHLYVAPLTIDGTSVEAGPARRVPTSLHNLTAVEWWAENWLVAAGMKANDRVALYDVTVDGAVEKPRVEDLAAAVTHIAAYPNNPMPGSAPAAAMYVANGLAYDGSPVLDIKADQVESPGGSTPPARNAKPTAPFFLY